jgi:hypothetical protein
VQIDALTAPPAPHPSQDLSLKIAPPNLQCPKNGPIPPSAAPSSGPRGEAGRPRRPSRPLPTSAPPTATGGHDPSRDPLPPNGRR